MSRDHSKQPCVSYATHMPGGFYARVRCQRDVLKPTGNRNKNQTNKAGIENKEEEQGNETVV